MQGRAPTAACRTPWPHSGRRPAPTGRWPRSPAGHAAGQEFRPLLTRLEPRRTAQGPGLAARWAHHLQNRGRHRGPRTNPQPRAARRTPRGPTQAHLQRRAGRPRPGRRRSPRSQSAGTRSAGGPRCGRGRAGSAPARHLHGHAGTSEAVHSGPTLPHCPRARDQPASGSHSHGWPRGTPPRPGLYLSPTQPSYGPWGQGGQRGGVGTPRPASAARPSRRASSHPAGPSRLGRWGGNPGEERGPCLTGDSRPQRAARAAGGLGRRPGTARAPHRWASRPRPQTSGAPLLGPSTAWAPARACAKPGDGGHTAGEGSARPCLLRVLPAEAGQWGRQCHGPRPGVPSPASPPAGAHGEVPTGWSQPTRAPAPSPGQLLSVQLTKVWGQSRPAAGRRGDGGRGWRGNPQGWPSCSHTGPGGLTATGHDPASSCFPLPREGGPAGSAEP